MYTISRHVKDDPLARWNLPDRVFFAAGACHILCYAFLEKFKGRDFRAMWVRPREKTFGSHIIATNGPSVFDYHGLSRSSVYFDHLEKRARQKWPKWGYDLVELPQDVLISESLSKNYEGLWLREPQQFYQNAMPRAVHFIDRMKIDL